MQKMSLITILVLLVLLAIIALQNQTPVKTYILFATVEMSHAVLLFITGAAGFMMGLLVAVVVTSRRRP